MPSIVETWKIFDEWMNEGTYEWGNDVFVMGPSVPGHWWWCRSGSKTESLKSPHRSFVGDCSWEPHLWGNREAGMGRERLNCDTFAAIAALVPWGTLDAGWTFQVPKERQGSWASISSCLLFHGWGETVHEAAHLCRISREDSGVSPQPLTCPEAGGWV